MLKFLKGRKGQNVRKVLSWAFIISHVLWSIPTELWGDDTELFTTNVPPRVMIILDSSGSMTFDIWSTYDNYTWGDGSPGYYGRDVNGDGQPNDSRLFNLKNALMDIVNNVSNVQFAFATYGQERRRVLASWYRTYPYGSSNRQYIEWYGYYWPTSYPGPSNIYVLRVPFFENRQQSIDSIIRWIDHQAQTWGGVQGAYEIRAEGGTPIGGTVYWIREYLRNVAIPSDPAKRCRRYFVLLLTDGEETGYPNYNPYNPHAEIKRLRTTVVGRDTLDIMTYVVGIGLPGSQQLEAFADSGGTDHYYPATSPQDVVNALNSILSLIGEYNQTFTSPEIPAITSKYRNLLYLASFIPSLRPFWKGSLKCYYLDPDGSFPTDASGKPLRPPIWDAGEALKNRSPTSRNIYTFKNGQLVPFTSSFITRTDLNVATNDSVNIVINYVRGQNQYNWKLGDIFHSEPTVIGPPNEYFQDQGYQRFRQRMRDRQRIIVVGSNSGILHAFDAGFYTALGDSYTTGTGEEVWGFIPPFLLPRLKTTLRTHQYMIDGPITASDVWVRSNPTDNTKDWNEWRTVLISGLRQGGNYYFALDLTNTISPVYLWSFTDPELGETWSKPQIGRVQIGSRGVAGETWVAIFGGGTYDPQTSSIKGRGIYVINAYTGQLIWKMTYNDGKPNSNLLDNPVSGSPAIIDIDGDGYIDRAYIGDQRGRLWRLDLSSLNPSNWRATPIFQTNTPQPVYSHTALSVSYNPDLKIWVYFGTGNRNSPRDTTSGGTFYCVVDDNQTSPYNESHLNDVTDGGTASPKGYYYRLGFQSTRKGEKIVSGPEVFGGMVYFTTYQPIYSQDPCENPGISRLYGFHFLTGRKNLEEIVGQGMPTSPQITISLETGTPHLVFATSAGQVITRRIGEDIELVKTTYWREIKKEELLSP